MIFISKRGWFFILLRSSLNVLLLLRPLLQNVNSKVAARTIFNYRCTPTVCSSTSHRPQLSSIIYCQKAFFAKEPETPQAEQNKEPPTLADKDHSLENKEKSLENNFVTAEEFELGDPRYFDLLVNDKKYSKLMEQLPPELRDAYRFNVTPEEAKKLPERIRRALTMVFANKAEINKYYVKKALERWQRKEGDSGSSEVQAAVLTIRINYISEHMKNNKQDIHNKYHLREMTNRRDKVLNYLRRSKPHTYYQVIKELNLNEPYIPSRHATR